MLIREVPWLPGAPLPFRDVRRGEFSSGAGGKVKIRPAEAYRKMHLNDLQLSTKNYLQDKNVTPRHELWAKYANMTG